ncbi:hypothetical protein GvMRE_I2g178 [endosymbiont GvMRE of Glomus versiforme]|nr:hypothetical protein GvMRE_I2g178 [endosymbiont GvMRE of Glomus versiforme]
MCGFLFRFQVALVRFLFKFIFTGLLEWSDKLGLEPSAFKSVRVRVPRPVPIYYGKRSKMNGRLFFAKNLLSVFYYFCVNFSYLIIQDCFFIF